MNATTSDRNKSFPAEGQGCRAALFGLFFERAMFERFVEHDLKIAFCERFDFSMPIQREQIIFKVAAYTVHAGGNALCTQVFQIFFHKGGNALTGSTHAVIQPGVRLCVCFAFAVFTRC